MVDDPPPIGKAHAIRCLSSGRSLGRHVNARQGVELVAFSPHHTTETGVAQVALKPGGKKPLIVFRAQQSAWLARGKDLFRRRSAAFDVKFANPI